MTDEIWTVDKGYDRANQYIDEMEIHLYVSIVILEKI